jgi:hypothetical protein
MNGIIPPLTLVRTRENRHSRLVGPNRYGRRGYRRCINCRKWRQKVTPSSPNILITSASITTLICLANCANNGVFVVVPKTKCLVQKHRLTDPNCFTVTEGRVWCQWIRPQLLQRIHLQSPTIYTFKSFSATIAFGSCGFMSGIY